MESAHGSSPRREGGNMQTTIDSRIGTLGRPEGTKLLRPRDQMMRRYGQSSASRRFPARAGRLDDLSAQNVQFPPRPEDHFASKG